MNPYRSVPEENIVDNPSIDHFKNKFIKKKRINATNLLTENSRPTF